MDNLTGKEFENLIIEQSAAYRKRGIADIERCGVQAVRMKDGWNIIKSKPDFEGVFHGGNQFIFDAKVCSQASFDLGKYREVGMAHGARSRQLRYMLKRSQFGATCFFLIHWNKREMKRSKRDAATFVFFVSHDIPFWEEFLKGNVKAIRYEDCMFGGVEIPWTPSFRGTKYRPNFLSWAPIEMS